MLRLRTGSVVFVALILIAEAVGGFYAERTRNSLTATGLIIFLVVAGTVVVDRAANRWVKQRLVKGDEIDSAWYTRFSHKGGPTLGGSVVLIQANPNGFHLDGISYLLDSETWEPWAGDGLPINSDEIMFRYVGREGEEDAGVGYYKFFGRKDHPDHFNGAFLLQGLDQHRYVSGERVPPKDDSPQFDKDISVRKSGLLNYLGVADPASGTSASHDPGSSPPG